MKAKRRIFRSHTSRLALLYAVIFSASTLLLFYFFYLFTAEHLTRQADNTIEAEIQGLAERYDRAGLEGLIALIKNRVRRQQAQATGNSIYLLTTYTFQPLAGNLDRWPKNATVDDDWIEFSLVTNQETFDTHLVRARIFRLPGRYGLLVGRDINQLTEAKRRIIQALTWGLGIMLLLACVGGVVMSRRTVRKIERINQTTRSIMSGDLSRRVPLTGHNDDFDQIAENLNQMLDRIQRLMEDIRRVSDSIAHDLRTPLARLRQHLEEARRQVISVQGGGNNARALLESSIGEADSLLSTFNALLRIARVEAGQLKFGFSAIPFHTLINDIAEFYEPLVEEKNQQIKIDLVDEIISWGDRDLLFQALANLVENAIKYTPKNGVIKISSRTKKHRHHHHHRRQRTRHSQTRTRKCF